MKLPRQIKQIFCWRGDSPLIDPKIIDKAKIHKQGNDITMSYFPEPSKGQPLK